MTFRNNLWTNLQNPIQNPIFSFVKEYLSRLQRQTSGVQEEDPDLFEDQGLKQEHLFAMERADAVSAIHVHVSPLSMRPKFTQYFFEIQEVKERDAEIKKTAQSIEELSGIFKELALLVIDRGTIADRIDYNLEYPNGSRTNGYRHPRGRPPPRPPSKRYNCTGRKKRKHYVCCYLLIDIMLIVLSVKNTPKSK
jgi:hypothetical protein